MTTALSKRHQARNERALQELIKTVPGNDRCADCGARNPGVFHPRTPFKAHGLIGNSNRMGELECQCCSKEGQMSKKC